MKLYPRAPPNTYQTRTVRLPWLNEMEAQQAGGHYLALRKPISLVARFLKAGEVLEDQNTTGPTPISRRLSCTQKSPLRALRNTKNT